MDSTEIAFKAVALVHGAAGAFLLLPASDEEFQKECFYSTVNPLAGDIKKYLVLIGCWALLGCGILAFKVPVAAVGLAWISLASWFLTGFVTIPWTRRLPDFCKICVVNFIVRLLLAGALTWLFLRLDG
jgi:hypothetical protein